MNKGKLIVIEGAVDGIGKSTQFALLREKLTSLGYTVSGHHFPSYGTTQGAMAEAYLRGDYGSPESLSPYFVNSVYALDRAVTWRETLSEKYFRGDIILLDRYTTSSLIYQSASIAGPDEKARFVEYVADYEYNKLQIPAPDAVIFLDAPYESAAALRKARPANDGVENDVHERDDSFMRSVWQSAQLVCDMQGWIRIRCTDGMGAMRSRQDIHSEIVSALSEVLA